MMDRMTAARDQRTKKLRRERLSAARAKGTHTVEQWKALQAEFPYCVRCLCERPTVKDHIIPLYQGGSDHIDNLQPLCGYCNCEKGPETTNWVAIRRANA